MYYILPANCICSESIAVKAIFKTHYDEIYEATGRTAGSLSAPRGREQDPRAHYRQLHGRILDNIICQTQTRFKDHEKLMFVTLLDPQKFREYKKNFPHAAFSS